MYGIIPLILIALPFIFQIIIGSINLERNFKTICLISLISQLLISFISFAIVSYNFEQSMQGEKFRCGPGILGFFTLIILFSILLLLTITIQFFIKKYKVKNNE